MKWLLYIGIVIAAILTLVVIAGALLPRNHVATRKARLKEPPQAIWDAVTGPSGWRSDLLRSDPLPARGSRRAWREVNRQNEVITFEEVESTPPRRLVTRIADPKLPFGGTWTQEIDPLDGGSTALRITENGEIYNPLFRFMARFVFGYTSSMEQYLRDLGKKFGENVEIEP
jgi:hypothetical protein